ncbi:GTP-binding protein Rho1 [Serendipita sp. 399]|nr:GTP-binding protein Rho1 [Serendipita sp. 399]
MSQYGRYYMATIGDAGVGKTCLFQNRSEEIPNDEEVDTRTYRAVRQLTTHHQMYYERVMQVQGDRDAVAFRILDEDTGKEAHQALITNAELIFLCFSIAEPNTLESIQHRWLPELLHFRLHENVQYILVGCKKDLRRDESNTGCVTRKMGEKMARIIGAIGYLECSARTGDGMHELFRATARMAPYSRLPDELYPPGSSTDLPVSGKPIEKHRRLHRLLNPMLGSLRGSNVGEWFQ